MPEPIAPPGAATPTLDGTLRRLEGHISTSEGREAPHAVIFGADLPVTAAKRQIQRTVERDDTVIVIGGTGSGKTTQIPKMIMEILPPGQKMAVTQPRKFATERTATRVAEEMGVEVGGLVGFQHRDAKKVGPETRMIFTVEGTLLRKLQQDITLPDFAVVMVDEVHERSVHGDLLLALLKRSQRARKEKGMPPLKIVATSATLETEKLEKYLELEGKSVEVPGTSPHTINEFYETSTDPKKDPVEWDQMPNRAAVKVVEIMTRAGTGNFAVFMPGKAWIAETIAQIQAEFKRAGIENDIEILPLHGGLSPEEQNRINENPGRRKIVVTSPVLETSVTLQGLKYVVDSGLVSEKRLDPQTGIERLMVVKNARSRNLQRRGRVGRIVSDTPDEYHALYDKDDHLLPDSDPRKRLDHQVAEVLRSNLAHVVLSLKKTGITDVRAFEFIDKPTESQMEQAHAQLKQLGALDESEELTELGHLMAEFPVDPHAAKLIIEGVRYGCAEQACTLAAILEGPDILPQSKDKAAERDGILRTFSRDRDDSDFLTMLRLFENWQTHKADKEWLSQPNMSALNFRALSEIEEVRDELVSIAKANSLPVTSTESAEDVSVAVASVFADQLFFLEDARAGVYKDMYGRDIRVKLGHDSTLYGARKPYIIAGRLGGGGGDLRASFCQSMPMRLLYQVRPQHVVKTTREPTYSAEKDEVTAKEVYAFRYNPDFKEVESIEVDKANASTIFLRALASGYVDVPQAIANRQLFNRGEISYEDMVEFYRAKLGTIASRKELEDAIASGGVDIAMGAKKQPGQASAEQSHGVDHANAAKDEAPQTTSEIDMQGDLGEEKKNFLRRTWEKIKKYFKKESPPSH